AEAVGAYMDTSEGREMAEVYDRADVAEAPVVQERPVLPPGAEQAAKIDAMAGRVAKGLGVSAHAAYDVITRTPAGREELAKYRAARGEEAAALVNAIEVDGQLMSVRRLAKGLGVSEDVAQRWAAEEISDTELVL